MAVRTVKDLDLSNKRVLMRADFNVPLKADEAGRRTITDETRIRAALPTIRYILEQPGARLILMSHLGRPKGKKNPEMSLAPVAGRLGELLGTNVSLAPDVVGEQVKAAVDAMKAGEVLILENVRFYAEEEKNDPGFAQQLASLGDVYVNDAFGTAHRAHASTEGVAHILPSAAGFLIEKEVKFLGGVLENPTRPFVAVVGGAKVSSKIAVLESLLPKCSTMVIGGGMAYTFLKAQGYGIGKSLLEEEHIDTARSLLKAAEERKVEIILPVDHLAAEEFSADAAPVAVDGIDIPDGLIGMDVGPKTQALVVERCKAAKTIVWNGPMGVFEFDAFSQGTAVVGRSIAESSAVSVVGGGDSVAAATQFGIADRMSHVSTGGGASLEFLEGKTLPGIAALEA